MQHLHILTGFAEPEVYFGENTKKMLSTVVYPEWKAFTLEWYVRLIYHISPYSSHSIALRCDAMRCVALRCDALCCVALQCDALRCVALRCDVMLCL